AVAIEVGPGPVERRLRRLFGIALTPGVRAQAPADLDLAVNRRARDVGELQPAETEQHAVALALDRPEGVAGVAVIALEPLERRTELLLALDPADVAPDLGRVDVARIFGAIGQLPGAEDQPLGLGGDLSHRSPPRRERPRRSPRRHVRGGCGNRG